MPPDTPAYLRIAADIRARILSGELPAGWRVQSETELMAEYGVSQTVAKWAINLLKGEGLVEGRRGSGVFVRDQRRLVRNAHGQQGMRTASAAGGPTSPFARDVAAAGRVARWDHHSEHTTADLDTARRLQIEPGAPVMATRYVYLADDEPIQAAWSREPLALTAGTPVEWPEEGAAVGVVARFDLIGITIDQCEERVRDRPATAEEIETLRLPPRRIHVQSIERTYFAEGQPIETADIVLPVGRYELVYRFPID